MDFRQIDKNLQIEFAGKKVKHEKIASQNLLRAKSNPVYLSLDKLERELVFEFSKCKAKDEKFKNIKQNLETVRIEKNKILSKLGLSEKDLKPQYTCSVCGDSGFLNGKPCECYKKRKNEELAKAFGLEIDKNCSFEKFDTKICKNENHANTLNKLAQILKKWAEKYPENTKNNIIISGKTGVGKTYLSVCLANELLQKQIGICFVSSFDLNEAFLKYHTSFDANKSSWIEPFIYCDVLFIDDLGTEPQLKNVTKNYLYLVISERERLNKPIIITTNLNPAEIIAKYDERIFSRLCNKRNSITCLIDGEDLRISK